MIKQILFKYQIIIKFMTLKTSHTILDNAHVKASSRFISVFLYIHTFMLKDRHACQAIAKLLYAHRHTEL